MNYNATDPDDAPADDDLPCVPSMDMLQDYYNAGHEYDEEEQDDEQPWD